MVGLAGIGKTFGMIDIVGAVPIVGTLGIVS